jgi:glycerophosphoryl diester phosphodiesterase
VAHRGLWRAAGPAENSLAAFAAAVAAGYGVELDVRLSKDGEAMVMHDAHLARMTGCAAEVRTRTAAELGALRLNSGKETVPRLSAALAVCGEALVLIEIKRDAGDEDDLDARVAEILAVHQGPAAVIGFSEASHAWWRDHHPGQLRGLNLASEEDRPAPAALDRIGAHFFVPSADRAAGEDLQQARRSGAPSVAWTVRTAEAADRLYRVCDNIIFEAFEP